jgi:hypothetical protein
VLPAGQTRPNLGPSIARREVRAGLVDGKRGKLLAA